MATMNFITLFFFIKKGAWLTNDSWVKSNTVIIFLKVLTKTKEITLLHNSNKTFEFYNEKRVTVDGKVFKFLESSVTVSPRKFIIISFQSNIY